MSATTQRHTLPLKLGRVFAVTVTETPDAVYIGFSGDKPRRSELQAVADFLWPIVSRYESDDRVIEMDGVRNPHGAARLHTLVRDDDKVLIGIEQTPRPRPNA